MKLRGNDLIVFFEQDGEWKTLAYGTTCEIDITADTMTVGSPYTGRWEKKKKRRISWNGSSGHLISMDSGLDAIYRMLTDVQPVKMLIGSVETHREPMEANNYLPDGRIKLEGDALITRLTVTGRKGDMATMSFSFQGTGILNVTQL